MIRKVFVPAIPVSISSHPTIPNVTYNISTKNTCGDTYLVGSKVNWEPYFKHMIECAKNDKAIEYDWTGSLSTGSVQILEFGNGVSEAAKQAVATAEAALKNGTLNVFDTTTFTVNGKHLTSYMADVDTDADYAKDTEVISNGVFMESEFRSAPYFITFDAHDPRIQNFNPLVDFSNFTTPYQFMKSLMHSVDDLIAERG